MTTKCKFLIIGAGPTGLGAAWRLAEHGYKKAEDWLLIESADVAGGLSASVVDEAQFTWDKGGHVIFSHYDYFDKLLDDLLGDSWVSHNREAWVYLRERFVPYPFQNNIWRLPADEQLACLEGLLDVNNLRAAGAQQPPKSFLEWIERSFGKGLAEVFFIPYNKKVWAYDPAKLSAHWVGERVATVDMMKVLHSVVNQKDDRGWGPNAQFRYPLHGGTGAIWRALADRLPPQCLKYNQSVVKIEAKNRIAHLASGEIIEYEYLISTMPLNLLVSSSPDLQHLKADADSFKYSSVHIVGIGMKGSPPVELQAKSWLYFPESQCPFYRVTVFSGYSPHNVPAEGEHWSLMCEVSESPDKAVNAATIVDDVIGGARWAKMIAPDTEIKSKWHLRIEHGYPTPFLGRDQLLDVIEPQLRAHNIFSRGRFGAWKYEVSNQDHSLMQGVEAVDHILFGEEESTFHYPGKVNAGGKNAVRPVQNFTRPV